MMTAFKQSQDGTPWSSFLTLLGSRKLLMMDREDARNM
jgi:hypothetical protein